MESSIRKLQLVELDILKHILPIINKHNLNYYMLGGTLLGAIRHNGFIPWDDDIDIGMPRPDYERFLEVVEKELKYPYEMQIAKNGSGLYYYPRIVNRNVKLLRKKGQQDTIIEAWIDIFPLDGVPENIILRKWWSLKATFYKNIFGCARFSYTSKTPDAGQHWSMIRKIATIVLTKFPIEDVIKLEWAWKRLDNALKSYDYYKSKKMYNFLGYWKEKEMFNKNIYGDGKLYKFEDIMLMGPENYDFVLRQMYGDYMKPPKNIDRNHHMVELISLNEENSVNLGE